METKQSGGAILFGMLGIIMLMLIIFLTNQEEEVPVFALGIVIPLLAFTALLFYNFPDATIYNITGMKAVELSFKGRRRKVIIRTYQPDELSRYINDMMHSRQM